MKNFLFKLFKLLKKIMGLRKDNVGAQSKDGIKAKVGIEYLTANRTAMIIPLQEDAPMDPEEMVIEGKPTYSINKMFEHVKPGIEVSLHTGDEKEPLKDAEINFTKIKDFEPEEIMKNVPLLHELKDKLSLINRVEELMQQGIFQRLMEDAEKKQALIEFFRSVIADIEAVEVEEDA